MLICKLKAYYHPDSFACWYTRCWWIVSVLGYKMSGYWKLECKLTSLNSLSLHDGKQILRCPIMASLHRINLTFLNLAWCLSIFPLKLLLCIVKTAAFYGLTSVFKRFQIFLGSHFPCFSSVYRQCMAFSEWWRACSHLTTWWRTPRSKTGTDAWRGRRSTTRAASESGVKETTEHVQPQNDWTVKPPERQWPTASGDKKSWLCSGYFSLRTVITAQIDFLPHYEFKPADVYEQVNCRHLCRETDYTHEDTVVIYQTVYLMIKLLRGGTIKSAPYLRVFY